MWTYEPPHPSLQKGGSYYLPLSPPGYGPVYLDTTHSNKIR
jgi:hypothetical protein